MPDENLDQPTYYPQPPRPGSDAEWEQAIEGAIVWMDHWDQTIGSGSTDTAAMAGEAYEVLRRLVAAIRERGL
jgi:hypothetical protein